MLSERRYQKGTFKNVLLTFESWQDAPIPLAGAGGILRLINVPKLNPNRPLLVGVSLYLFFVLLTGRSLVQ